MADTRKIVIEIISSTNQEPSPSPTPTPSPTPQTDKTKDKSNDLATALLVQGLNSAKQLASQAIDSVANRYFSMTEDYLAETTYNNVKSNASRVASLGASLFAGAKLGAAGGPVGVAVGMTITGGLWAASQGLQINQNLSNYYSNINASNINTNFAQTRAGLTNGSKGTEN